MFQNWSIQTVYIICSVVGGGILSLQMLLLLFGADAEGPDTDIDGGDGHDITGWLSVRSVAAFLTFFGLFGWWGHEAGWGTAITAAAAFGAGLAMMVTVLWLMSLLRKLSSEGTLQPENALGKPASVYLRIPGENSGQGKITVSIQGRTKEFAAVTNGPEIPTGNQVRVVRMVTQDTFEVAPLLPAPTE